MAVTWDAHINPASDTFPVSRPQGGTDVDGAVGNTHQPADTLTEDGVSVQNDGELSDSEDDTSQGKSAPRTASQKRTNDNLAFTQWVRDEQQSIYSRGNNPAQTGAAGPRWEEKLTQGQTIIATPRTYQTELFERAKDKNTIVVLPTGTGKTLISALLLRHTIEQELEDRAAGKPPRISFFLVDKVALAFQQYRVLKENLDFPVQRFCGDFSGPSSSHAFWKEQTEKNMVIVCTAAVLQSCLHHAFVHMSQINLLVFDEAHHTKKKHPYAQIIKDFYSPLEREGHRCPRILGMTASPVDSKANIHEAAAKLEALLHSEIETVKPDLLEDASIHQPNEDFIEYAILGQVSNTPLYDKMHSLVGENDCFNKIFAWSRGASSELGRWCADRVWPLCFTDDERRRIVARTEDRLLSLKDQFPMDVINAKLTAINSAYDAVPHQSYAEARGKETNQFWLSSKVLALRNALQSHFDPFKDKCIVFVEQRLTALVLKDLFTQDSLSLPGVRPGALLGSGSGGNEPSEATMTITEQITTVSNFLASDINCLFATSIGEEGLDIPDCNMIVRFDPCKTVIQYIQSRGRGRQAGSKYFHMVQFGNEGHIQSVFDNRDNEFKINLLCNAIPADRVLRGDDFPLEYFLAKESGQRSMIIKATGAKLTYQSSLVILDTFVSTLPNAQKLLYRPEYVVKSFGKGFQCEVLLPETSPVQNALGTQHKSKQAAKCSAAFEMCLRLRKMKCLDDHFESTFAKKLPAMRNAQLALSSKKLSQYPMRTKPGFWEEGLGIPEILYATVIKLDNPEAYDRPNKPLIILTRKSLPRIARFPLFFGSGSNSTVHLLTLREPIKISPEEVEQVNEFTLRIFLDIFSKEYESKPEIMPYFIVPYSDTYGLELTESADARELIDWGCVTMIHESKEEKYENLDENPCLENRFVVDAFSGARKFFTRRRRADLRPTDPHIPEPPRVAQSKAYKKNDQNIWNFSSSFWNNKKRGDVDKDSFEVLEAEFVSFRRNFLDEFDNRDSGSLQCFIVLHTLKISKLPADLVFMAYLLPALIFRLDSNLIVYEACRSIGLGDISLNLALEAMTKDSDNTGDHASEQINFQAGMGTNYERLEFLGDCYLKMSVSISLFAQTPDSDEFESHVNRMLLIRNKNLFNNALDLKLEQSIRSKAFNRRTWYPENLKVLKGKVNDSIMGKKGLGSLRHELGDKTIADVCEALIGAAYLTTYDSRDLDLAVRAVTIFTNNDHHRMRTWDDFKEAYKTPTWQTAPASAADLELARQVHQELGYEFRYPLLLRSAFTHPTYGSITTGRRIPDYQRLEFLGDSLLDMVCVDFLFHKFPSADPQWLTEHKMAMVSNQFLGCLSVSLGMPRHMLSMSAKIRSEIADYATALEAARDESCSSSSSSLSPSSGGGHRFARNYWVGMKRSPPKAISDLVEAYLGAAFIDSGFDLGPVRRFFDAHIRPYFEDMHLYDDYATAHPVTNLSQRLSQDLACSSWRLMVSEIHHEEGAETTRGSGSGVGGGGGLATALPTKRDAQVLCGILIHGQVREHAIAASGRYAKIAAAKKAIALLDGLDVAGFRAKFGCDCGAGDGDGCEEKVAGG